ncbi:peptidylprolyl isomerase [Marinigracilibium pacificum]|uniref:PpiC domain-containing protein n=1 Tax=Marinigracilibium pacificum TaxID=2729599 RepID=A0A848J543_9BACT|nr:peptidylprolyl isomerase [Marinigracilibium pacificum]NMM50901.1 hypothetical protein [Marinigracilibium pacificum]
MRIKLLVILTLIIATTTINAQNKKQVLKALKEIKGVDQVNAFKKKYKDWTIQSAYTFGIDSIEHHQVVNTPVGNVFTRQYDNGKINVVVKVLARRIDEICKVQYIFFDGSKMTVSEIDSTRNIILDRYNNGTDFTTLVKEYTMDGNPTGELRWFFKGVMVEEFETAVMPKNKGDIFTVDVDSRKWYYVVLKTHKNIKTTVTDSIGIKYGI